MKKTICLLLTMCTAMGLFGCGKAAEKIDPNAIAGVTNGDATTYVLTVEELVAAIDPSGNTVVTLLKDVECKQNISLPYSCTVDLGGYKLVTNPQRGIGITVEEAGKENALTTLKNGTMETYAECLRVKGGSFTVSGVRMYATQGPCVSLHTPVSTCKTQNRIENSTLAAARGSCFIWGTPEADYTGSVLSVENTALIAYEQEGRTVFNKANSAVVGVIELVGGNHIYSYADMVGLNNMRVDGTGLYRSKTDLDVNGTGVSGINYWCDDTENQVIDVLMIGNSFCYYFVQELHGIANAAGVQMNIGNLYYGACVVEKHWQWLQTNSAQYQQYWVTNDFGRYQNTDLLSMRKALDSESWDVVTLQQHYFSGVDDYDTAMGKV